jgi:hypothetical protein
MLARLRARLTYANVVATLALFVALGGVSYGAARIGTASIINNSVRTQDLRNNDIRSRDIRNRTIVHRDILANTITGRQVRESSLAKVPDADTLDGVDSSSLRVGCPAGTTRHGGGCIETSARPPQTYEAAARTCGSAGRRLPSYDELASYRQEPGVTLGSGGGGAAFELTADVTVVTAGQDEVVGIDDQGDNAPLNMQTAARAFRCVAPLAN